MRERAANNEETEDRQRNKVHGLTAVPLTEMRRDDWREGNTQKIQRKPQYCNLHLNVEVHHNARDAGRISRSTECSIRVIRHCLKGTS